MSRKWQSIEVLLEAVRDSDCSWRGRQSMYRLEKRGKLTLPRTASGQRKVTERMVFEIIKAFEPGGIGEWHYDNIREGSKHTARASSNQKLG